MVDFCYLINCYYPPKKMLEEMKANFDSLVCQYPSGMYVNSLLAARNFGLRQDQIVPGNGAAELIKIILEHTSGRLGVIRPTFEAYSNRYQNGEVVPFWPENENFRYTAADLMEFFRTRDIQNLVIINPDNPTGNYLSREEVLSLIAWTGAEGIRLIVDESFVDFASEEGASILCEGLLDANPHLTVIKSISKSYGVPGLRLGIAASGDSDLISLMKKEVSIWNINSLGEFYMQIEEKYRKDYAASLIRLKAERQRFAQELAQVPGIRVLPSEADYLMAEVTGISSAGLTELLLNRYNLFIKDLSSKIPGDC